MILKIHFYKQDTPYTCGPASLQMVLSFFGDFKSESELSRIAKTDSEQGTTHSHLIETARKEGFYCYVNSNSTIPEIKHFLGIGLPVIVNYIESSSEENHYSVVTGFRKGLLVINDPWNGRNFHISEREFAKRWHGLSANHPNKNWIMAISKEDFRLGRQYPPLGK